MPHRLAALPTFTRIDDNDAVDLWPEAPAQSYSDGNALGRSRAQELIDTVHRTRSLSLLTQVMEVIASRGSIGGMEVGFFHGLSRELLNPEVITEFVSVPPERQFRVGRKLGPLAVVVNDDEAQPLVAAAG
jgi:hypothetical protein